MCRQQLLQMCIHTCVLTQYKVCWCACVQDGNYAMLCLLHYAVANAMLIAPGEGNSRLQHQLAMCSVTCQHDALGVENISGEQGEAIRFRFQQLSFNLSATRDQILVVTPS